MAAKVTEFIRDCERSVLMGNQHPSPHVKTSATSSRKIWLEIITSRDAKVLVLLGKSKRGLKPQIFRANRAKPPFWKNGPFQG